tara:strand:- start:611 stop:790 length:180 start_codon:yes stop_codon:yes gene_type:complete
MSSVIITLGASVTFLVLVVGFAGVAGALRVLVLRLEVVVKSLKRIYSPIIGHERGNGRA